MKHNKEYSWISDSRHVCHVGRRVFRTKPVLYGCNSSLYVITMPSRFRRSGFTNLKRRLKEEWKSVYRDYRCKWGKDEV